MKRPFDTLVGPGGVWKDEGAADEEETDAVELTAREDFALRCLNAAANLYGVVTMDEFVSLYNGYAKSHAAPVSAPMTVAELDGLVDRLFALLDSEPLSMEECLDRPEIWFSTWQLKAGEPRLIVYSDLTAFEDGDNRPDAEKNREITERKPMFAAEAGKDNEDKSALWKSASIQLASSEKGMSLSLENRFCSDSTGKVRPYIKGSVTLIPMGVQCRTIITDSQVQKMERKLTYALDFDALYGLEGHLEKLFQFQSQKKYDITPLFSTPFWIEWHFVSTWGLY